MNVFSVMLKLADELAPSRIFKRVGVSGGRYETLLTFHCALPAV